MNAEPLGAIVLGGDYRGLDVVRSLGRHGIPVWVLRGEDHQRLATASRFCQRSLPWPERDDDRLTFLEALCARYGLHGWRLIPTGDRAAAFLAQQERSLPRALVSTAPPWHIYRWAYDKRLSYELAATLGIRSPETRQVCRRADVEQYSGPFPVILKPAVRPRNVRRKAWQANDRTSLLATYTQVVQLLGPDPVLLQELVPGNGESQYSFGSLCREGEPLAWVVARRLRQQPMDFGRLSTFVESTRDTEVELTSRGLLAALGITGLVEIEYKRDARDGSLRLLDINARVWGWQALARQRDMDFPYLLWELFDGKVPRRGPLPSGLRWIRLISDVSAAAPALARGQLRPGPYLHSVVSTVGTGFARDDPLPSLLEVPLLSMVAFRRLADRIPPHLGPESTHVRVRLR